MENLVVGLAKSVVEGALSKVQSAIEEDEQLRTRAQGDLAFMTVEFEMMQSFLDMANKENVRNKLVATWVRNVRKVAYDVQDCIELVIHLDDGPTWRRRLLPACWREPLPLDVAVAEIEQLKARVKDVSKCYTRYNLINDAGSRLVMLQEPASRATAGDLLIEARQATRRQQRRGDLTQLITNTDSDFQVISVWGVGGDHGTASLLRKAYNDPEICHNFSCRSWVKLMRPFNPDEFVRTFLAQHYANNSCQDQGESVAGFVRKKLKATHDELFNDFTKQIGTRYLIVLENLSNMVDWDAIRTLLPPKTDGSRIIVSTQQPEVATLCVGHSYQLLELKKFSDDHSVCAFFDKGCHGGSHSAPGNKGNDIKLTGAKSFSRRAVTPVHITQGSSSGLSPEEVPLIARRYELNELRKITAMARINSSQVTAVWGMPGVGKAAIVKSLYIEKMGKHEQFTKYGCWVDLSPPFNLRDFSLSLLLGLDSESTETKEYRVKDPIKACRVFLSTNPCFVVINNLQSTEDWDLIEDSLVSRPSKSVMVVLTNEADIAAHCVRSKEELLNVKGLEADAAFTMFKTEVERVSRVKSLPLKDDHAGLQELILRCGGLPIVIGAIARWLATAKGETKWNRMITSLNEGFLTELETKPQFQDLHGLFGWMHSYIGNCPDFLKPCILYLSIFPPDKSVRRRRLVRRWVSEGYSKESSRSRSVEEYGEDLFTSLVKMSIIQQPTQSSVAAASSDTRMVWCQVNSFLYEYIISRQKEENLVFQLGKGSSISTQCTWHHLTIWEEWSRDQIVFENMNLSRLRSLTVFGDWKSFFVSKAMKLLRVLDLENASGVRDQDLEQMLKLLRRLKFLSLRGCAEVCNLPGSIGGLRQLQSLDIRHTSIVTLPANITRLKKLQYIRAGTIVKTQKPWTSQIPGMGRLVGVKVPRGLAKVKALHTVGVINVSASRGKGVVKQLKKLTQLHKLGVSGIHSGNSCKLFSAISAHGHLESLSVRLKKGSENCLDGISLPAWEKLESLKLYGLGSKLPQVPSNRVLTKLVLEMDDLTPEDMSFLGDLPNLCILRLRVEQKTVQERSTIRFMVEMYGLELPTFTKVKILEITSSSSLNVTFGKKTMKQLEVLKLDFSTMLKSYKSPSLDDLPDQLLFLLNGKVEKLKNGPPKELVDEATSAVMLEEQRRASSQNLHSVEMMRPFPSLKRRLSSLLTKPVVGEAQGTTTCELTKPVVRLEEQPRTS